MATAKTANEALDACYEDHKWEPAVFDTNTTEGIQRTLKAQSAAIQALADHIDGVDKDAPREPKPVMTPVPTNPNPPAL